MVKVISAKLEDDYKIYVEFNNGKKGTIDFQKILEADHRKPVKDLLNRELFKTVQVNLNTLCWENEVDFAPDYLLEQLKTKV